MVLDNLTTFSSWHVGNLQRVQRLNFQVYSTCRTWRTNLIRGFYILRKLVNLYTFFPTFKVMSMRSKAHCLIVKTDWELSFCDKVLCDRSEYCFFFFQYRAIHGSTEFLSVEEDRGSNEERTMWKRHLCLELQIWCPHINIPQLILKTFAVTTAVTKTVQR